jgi:hypothetical protein
LLGVLQHFALQFLNFISFIDVRLVMPKEVNHSEPFFPFSQYFLALAMRANSTLLTFGKTHRQDIGIKDDVMRIEPDLVDENTERPFTNFDLAVFVGGLAELVEGHDDNGSSELLDGGGLRDEVFLALL